MFNRIIKAWSKNDLLSQSYSIVGEALNQTEKMFLATTKDLIENKKKFNTFKEDKKVNRAQIAVRKKILTHLSMSPEKDLVGSLILLQVVLDLERIGDYCKNIAETNKFYKEKISKSKHHKKIESYRREVIENFALTKLAFKKCDMKSAKKVMKSHGKIKDELDELAFKMLKTKLLDSREAAAIALYARYLKRINSHLQHIASTVTNPFPKIGFASTKRIIDDN